MADFVPGYEASGFAGIGVPKGTPAEIIDKLNKELNAGLADSKIKGRIVELGGTVTGGSPAEFGTIISEATEKWAKGISSRASRPNRAERHGIQFYPFLERGQPGPCGRRLVTGAAVYDLRYAGVALDGKG